MNVSSRAVAELNSNQKKKKAARRCNGISFVIGRKRKRRIERRNERDVNRKQASASAHKACPTALSDSRSEMNGHAHNDTDVCQKSVDSDTVVADRCVIVTKSLDHPSWVSNQIKHRPIMFMCITW